MDKIIAVASGKGGVGKSTVAVSLAACFANPELAPGGREFKVALVDADFYGPSIPTLMGGGEVSCDEFSGKMLPISRYGVKFFSIGLMLRNPDDPVIWRGPMLGKGVSDLFNKVDWGLIDICIVDLPPGTGDVQLSIAQQVSLDGVVVVTTPQEVALSDVRKAIKMFDRVNVPVLGIIENMAGFVTPSGERWDIFGAGGGALLAEQYDTDLLGSIPIDMDIRVGGDTGCPAILAGPKKDGDCANSANSNFVMRDIASKVWTLLEAPQPTVKLKIEN